MSNTRLCYDGGGNSVKLSKFHVVLNTVSNSFIHANRQLSEFDGQNTLPQRSSALTGCAPQNVSPSNWQLWRIDLSTAPLRPTHSRDSPAFPTWWHPDDGCGLLYLTLSGHSARSSIYIQSAGGRFRFLVPPCGTTCLSTPHLRRHSRFSDNDSGPFCFPVPTKTLSYDSCVSYYHSSLLSVVLAIINII